MSWQLQLRTNSGCTALLVLFGDQTVSEVTNVYNGLVSRDNSYGFRPLSCTACGANYDATGQRQPCDTHNSATPWLPLEMRDAVIAAGAQAVGA